VRGRLAVVGAVAAISLVTAQGASAATEVGDTCSASAYSPNTTFFQVGRAPGTLPLTVPSAGVVTQWKVVSELSAPEAEQLKVFRGTGNGNEFTVTGASVNQLVSKGLNVFNTRIPVAAGDHFGVTGNALYCSTTNSLDVMGYSLEPTPVGSTKVYPTAADLQAAVSAVVEPDVDGDGFGDETQDQCPQSAALQTACPALSISSRPLTGKGAVVQLVAASSQAPVTVTGTVKIAGAPKKNARSSSLVKLRSAGQTVVPGKFARFTLKFPTTLKAKLKELSPKQSLKLAIVTSATDAIGRVTKSVSSVKLKGQG
jgi:hypothetical protein